jgi:hypothetical protein
VSAHFDVNGADPASPPPVFGPSLFRRLVAALAVATGIGLALPLPAGARERPLAQPLVLTVQTVPPVGGVVLTLDGTRSFVSQADGLLVASVFTRGDHTLALTLPRDDDRTRYTFVRWSDESFQPVRQIRMHENHALSVGLQVAYRTQVAFSDPAGKSLEASRVSNVILSGPDAEVVKLDYPYAPIWLHTPLPAKHMGDNGLHVVAVPYSISSVDYDGLNVASMGQERYLPAAGGTWVVPLRLYRLTLRAKDALFGSSLSRSLTLTSPSGQRQLLRLDGSGQVSIVAGRGNYTARVHAAGISPLIPIALSRSQTADISVITPIDLVVLGFACLAIVAILFAVGRGRQRLLRMIQKRVTRARPAA